jgi:hypothetical protein
MALSMIVPQHECSLLTFVFWIILSFSPTMKGCKHMFFITYTWSVQKETELSF